MRMATLARQHTAMHGTAQTMQPQAAHTIVSWFTRHDEDRTATRLDGHTTRTRKTSQHQVNLISLTWIHSMPRRHDSGLIDVQCQWGWQSSHMQVYSIAYSYRAMLQALQHSLLVNMHSNLRLICQLWCRASRPRHQDQPIHRHLSWYVSEFGFGISETLKGWEESIRCIYFYIQY